MRWLIDGYNVIRRDPDLRGAEAESLERGRAALSRLVVEATRRCRDRFTIVFDGAPSHASSPSSGAIEIVFSRPPQSADDVLISRARQLGDGAIVVTSDHTVRDAARRAGATVLTSEAFVAALERRDGDVETDDDADDESTTSKRGNPRRLSKDERAARRALLRLRGAAQ
jgi:uncharacterized protein